MKFQINIFRRKKLKVTIQGEVSGTEMEIQIELDFNKTEIEVEIQILLYKIWITDLKQNFEL